MITIAKRFTFDAAHFLPCMPEGHKCRGMHGHTYQVTLVLRGHVNRKDGILVDYDDIAKAWAPLDNMLDHKLLNEILGLEMPSTENLVIWLFSNFALMARRGDRAFNVEYERFWDKLHTIRVEESTTTWCEMSKVEYLAFHGDMA